MINILKKHDFPLPIERRFTDASRDPIEQIYWLASEPSGDDDGFEAPAHWSREVAASFAEAVAFRSIPAGTRSVEENTVPSWLWRRQKSAQSDTLGRETSVRQILQRVAGSATYTGWKHGIFADEDEARAFHDEIGYLLAQRFIALTPAFLATAGLDWAYGAESEAGSKPAAPAAAVAFEAGNGVKKAGPVEIRNATIDSLLANDEKACVRWQKFLAASMKEDFLTLRFADIAGDWNASPPVPARAALDLLAFRREDGSVDTEKLCHATRMLAILLELQSEGGSANAIGFHNLAALLMSQGLAYDSDAGRATAAALAAIITAEASCTSAQLAALLGPSLDFAANRESILRTLRNHRRAAYGDRNDYEKVSVLPVSLTLDPGADITLIAAARHRWDEALELVRQHGLRATQFTCLTMPSSLAHFMESASSGMMAMPSLTLMRAVDDDVYRREINPAVPEALFKLDYDADKRAEIVAHILGTGTLENAPFINHQTLHLKGFDDRALEDIENYLSNANDIRLAFTPWVIGEAVYRDVLKIPESKIRDPKFDLLKALGFSAENIKAANAYCYGTGSAHGAKALHPNHAAVLSHRAEIEPEAHIRMAASVQSFISGEAGLSLVLDGQNNANALGKLLLSAWRQGVKAVTVELINRKAPAAPSALQKQLAGATFKAPVRSTLRGKPKAQGKLVSLKRSRPDKPHRPEKG